MRPGAISTLLDSVSQQTLFPNEIVVVDGSVNDATKEVLATRQMKNLQYFMVSDSDRGLTRQRNFGIERVGKTIDVVCFLDDDIVLDPHYFECLIRTYKDHPDALGVGGYITNEVSWVPSAKERSKENSNFYFDGFERKDGSRFVLRKRLGLDADRPPGFMPGFSHGRSVSFLPPSNKVYEVQQFMGGVASYKMDVFKQINFSTYFEGYGLYEDADFTLRLSKLGKLFVNTAAKCEHFHDASGRPNMFLYGKMVLRNGWYVWRVAHPNPSIRDRIKWNAISYLLTLIRFSNILTTKKRKIAFTEAIGRTYGWLSLLFNKPRVHV